MLFISQTLCFGQQAAKKSGQSHKFRTIFTIVGGGGGFALGVFAGIGAFDDSINASRKITTTALITAAGGAVGGYFIGRALDKRGTKTKVTRAPDALDLALMHAYRSAGLSVGMRDLKHAPVLPAGFHK
jgi:hypothetical protein